MRTSRAGGAQAAGALACAALVLASTACRRGEPARGSGTTGATGQPPPAARPASGPSAPAATTAAAAAPLPGPGRIEGVARYVGTNPLRVKQLTNDIDVAACGERIQLQTVLLGEGGTIANVFVEIRADDGSVPPAVAPPGGSPNAAAGPGTPPVRIAVDIRRCALEPHVLVVPTGSEVEIRNLDGILHHLVAPALRNEPFEARLPRYRKRLVLPEASLPRAEKIEVACGVHPWEVGWWIVTDDPLRALTARDGRFAIENVPPGTWQVMAWHEGLNRTEVEVTVMPGATSTVEIAFR